MKMRNKIILTVIAVATIFVSHVYANTPMQSFWNTIDKMPIEKRIDFYEKAITVLQKIENNTKATSILTIMMQKYSILQNQSTLGQIQYIPHIDYTKIREQWIQKHNNIRSEAGLNILQNNDKLNKTAQIRANYVAENNIPSGSTHKRESTDGYYDYNKILQWFNDQGVGFSDTNNSAFSENIGYGYYRACSDTDCTAKLLEQTRSTRDFFIGEASRNGPHYRALMGASFTQIGIGVARNDATKKYYIVIHYGVETI